MGPMNNLQSLIDQMAVDISSQAAQLDDLRLPRFLAWLDAHSIKVKIAADANQAAQLDDLRLPRFLPGWTRIVSR